MIDRIALSVMAIFSWTVSQFIVRPRPTLSEVLDELRHPSKEPFA